METRIWPVWKTITLGINQEVAAEIINTKRWEHDGHFTEPISQQEYSLDPGAFDLLQHPDFSMSQAPSQRKLVLTTLEALGLSDGTCYDEIFAAARNAGLLLCPAEVGLQLRLQYMKQPYGETLVIAMNPIEDEDGLPSMFTVHHWDWGIGLGADCCGRSNLEDDWHADSDWIFYID